jgi:sodium/potassium/calcium exchanger 6
MQASWTSEHPNTLTRMPKSPARKSYRAARAFYLVVLIGLLLAACAAYARRDGDNLGHAESPLSKRDVGILMSEEEQCRLVHRSKDQCRFIKKHCPDDEGGFGTYLDLFYCKLSHAKPVAFMILISWLGLLFSTIGIAASDFFCINLSTIASILGMSESMAGVTLLAFGNGSPDVFSTFAAMSTNSGSLAVGELMGAAVFITSVVAGSMALIKPFHVARKSFVRDVGFFIVAAGFSFSFLWDGRLQLWECIAMVIYYVVYVGFVVAWHWWIGRRRREREKQAAARGHYLPPGDEMDLEEEYRDDPESNDSETARPTLSRGASREDFAALERGFTTPGEEETNEDEEEEARDRWISELNSNMRLSRPQVRSRRNTIGPVRPSLVGALEFQAVLNSLQKSRNIQTIPLDTRGYSDTPDVDLLGPEYDSTRTGPSSRQSLPTLTLDTSAALDAEGTSLIVPNSAPARGRAVSASDASSRSVSPSLRRPLDLPDQSDWHHTEHAGVVGLKLPRLEVPGPGRHSAPQTPSVEVSAPTPTFPIMELPEEEDAGDASDRLRVADAEAAFRRQSDFFSTRSRSNTNLSARSGHSGFSGYSTESDSRSPRAVPQARDLPKIMIPRERGSRESTPSTSPFPVYWEPTSAVSTRPPSMHLPPPLASPESLPVSQSAERASPSRPTRWWPYHILPAPGILISTLFPTIYHWHEKSIWEKMIGVVAAPSVFFLTVTLPVVESEKDNEEDDLLVQPTSYDSRRSQNASGMLDDGNSALKGSTGSKGGHSHTHSVSMGTTGRETMASLVTTTEQQNRHNFGTLVHEEISPIALDPHDLLSATPDHLSELSIAAPNTPIAQESSHWNRWLVLTQLYLAPLFCMFSFYVQSPSDLPPSWLTIPTLSCLLTSTILLIPFLLTTTSTHRPNIYRSLLSGAGFVVSIAWISTIASQVVGALKALAVICNMSHAIMGLTIFAVGNSLGDLVADITVAKLGYPVMALSACFGGPMLNILLGIGLSGTYILITGAHEHQHKHPGSHLRYKSYQIEVGRTLIVTGITLLVTLVGLLIFVPLNKWVLSKRIGVALISLWVVTTILNVALELTGWGMEGSDS